MRDVLERRAIGEIKVGASFSEVADRYGAPTEVVDPHEYGFDERCKIWNYDAVQVWSDAYGQIDRVFFDADSEQAKCSNQNLIRDMAALRHQLKRCDIETFDRVLHSDRAKAKRRSNSTEVSVVVDDTEIFATFVAKVAGAPQFLSTLRLNAVADPVLSKS